MTVPDAVDLVIRDIEKSIYERKMLLDKWDMQQIVFDNPAKYKNSGIKKVIFLGDHWNNEGKSFLFSREISIPDELIGREIYLEIDIGGESLLYSNGNLKRGINERFIFLSNSAKKKYKLDIIATYNVHEYVRSNRLYERDYHPHIFKTANIVVKNKIVEEYYYLIKTAYETFKVTNREEYKRGIKGAINNSLQKVLFHDKKLFLNSIEKAKKVLLDDLNKLKDNYPYPGKIFFSGHSHLDLAFKWTVDITIRKSRRTLSTVIELMDRHKNLFFLQSQPLILKYIKKYYPGLYKRIKEKIVSGQLEPVGAMMVEADSNLPSGESLIRQILYGKSFLKREFGVDTEICWLPDTFGFTASLPQILKKTGLNYFVTSKLLWNDTNNFPYNLFKWQGIDGSTINAYLLTRGYGGDIEPGEVKKCWENLSEKNIVDSVLYLYGYGDGGGGVTSEMLNKIEAVSRMPGLPDIDTGSIKNYLANIFATEELPKWKGELYLEKHRGVYTSQAILKKKNRYVEFLYREAEIWSTINIIFLNNTINIKQLKKGWELILKNQFHDILPGSCVKEVVNDAIEDYDFAIKEGNKVLMNSLSGIIDRVNTDKGSIVVFNSLPWNRTDIVKVKINNNKKVKALKDNQNNIIPVQQSEGYIYFVAINVPSLGYCSYTPIEEEVKQEVVNEYDNYLLENDYFKLAFNKNGNLISIFDKKNNKEIIPEGLEGNQFQIFEDKSTYFDSWDLNISDNKKYIINNLEKIEHKVDGPVFKSILIKKRFNKTKIEQEIIIYNNVPRIDFKTWIDWKERQMLLKVAFPIDIVADKASFDIAFGNYQRPVHNNTTWEIAKSEVSAHKWVDISEYGYGVSLLNNCKYGYDIKDNIIRLTLLKGGIYPDPEADLGKHSFTYSLYPHLYDFKRGGSVHMGYNLNQPLRAKVKKMSPFKKELPSTYSFININKENVIIETIKKAESDNGYILRCYEIFGKQSDVTISTSFQFTKILEANLIEEPLESNDIKTGNRYFTFSIKPYEIKTFILYI